MSDIDSMTMSAPRPSKLVVLNPTNKLGRKEPNMMIIGVDFHPEFQQIAAMDTETIFRQLTAAVP